MKAKLRYRILIHLILILMCLNILVPFIYVISLSMTAEDVIVSGGYKMIPAEFDFSAYQSIFKNPTQLINSYKITIYLWLL